MRIHQIWLGDRPAAWILRCMATVREHHPDWEYVLWNEESIRDGLDMRYRDIYDKADQFALPGRVHQFRSDLARYEILNRYGGVYVDCDMEFLRPLDAVPDVLIPTMGLSTWMAWEKQDEFVSNAIIGARPVRGNFLDHLADTLTEHIYGLRRKAGLTTASRLTGPRYITSVMRKFAHNPVRVYDQELFFPYDWSDVARTTATVTAGRTARTIAVHHWANQRRINSRPLPPAEIGAS